MMNSYTVKIKQFEGPFDLLLYFIQRDESDINDIPIAKITKDFLEYIKQLEELNLDTTVTKVEDIQKIMEYSVMRTPALVIDEKVVLSGQLPKVAEIKELLTNHS